jgi:hypothetical protein
MNILSQPHPSVIPARESVEFAEKIQQNEKVNSVGRWIIENEEFAFPAKEVSIQHSFDWATTSYYSSTLNETKRK